MWRSELFGGRCVELPNIKILRLNTISGLLDRQDDDL